MVATHDETPMHLHLEEADILKKQWFSHVFETLNRLHEQITDNSRQAQRDREQIQKELVKLKAGLLVDLKTNTRFTSKEREKVEERLVKMIQSVEDQLVDFCKEDFKELYGKVGTLTIKQTAMGTKLTAYVTMLTVGVTSVLGVLATGVLILFRDAIKAWLGA